MAEIRLAQIFDDCINRLNRGETIEDCLRAYPEYQRQLQPMLEAGRLARRLTLAITVSDAQARVGMRFEQALRNPNRVTTRPSRWLTWVAVWVLLVGLFGGGLLAAAQTAIPGDNLYGIKQWSENTALVLTGNSPRLQEQFAQRRVDETQQLVTLKRPAEITFAGTIETVSETMLVLHGLTVLIPIDTPALAPGMRVEIQARTDTNGQIIALNIREARQLAPQANFNPPTSIPFATPTSIPTITLTPMPDIFVISTVAPANTIPNPTATLPAPAVFPPPNSAGIVQTPCLPNTPCEPRPTPTNLPVCAPGVAAPCLPNQPDTTPQPHPTLLPTVTLRPLEQNATPPVPPCNRNGTPMPCPPQTPPARPTLLPTVTLRPLEQNATPPMPPCNRNGTPMPCPPHPTPVLPHPTLPAPSGENVPPVPCDSAKPCLPPADQQVPPPNNAGHLPPDNPLPPGENVPPPPNNPVPPEGNAPPVRPPEITPPPPPPAPRPPGNNG